jgi:hypothetical protein
MNDTLALRLRPAVGTNAVVEGALILAGTLLLAVSANVQVPFWPVPLTMQTFVVLLMAATFGAARQHDACRLSLRGGNRLAGFRQRRWRCLHGRTEERVSRRIPCCSHVDRIPRPKALWAHAKHCLRCVHAWSCHNLRARCQLAIDTDRDRKGCGGGTGSFHACYPWRLRCSHGQEPG